MTNGATRTTAATEQHRDLSSNSVGQRIGKQIVSIYYSENRRTNIVTKDRRKTACAEGIPFLDLSVTTIERPGQEAKVDITGPFGEKTALVKASCAPGEKLVGSGMHFFNMGELDGFQRTDPNTWAIITTFHSDGSIASFAECLKVELALKQ